MKVIIRLSKNLGIFFFIFGFLFSNLPFDIVSAAVRQFAVDRNVVDAVWLAQKDSNVVDIFVPFQKIADGLRIQDVYAAVGDARIEYGQSTNAAPWNSFYTTSSNSWSVGATTGIAGTANVGWTVAKESPTEDVTVLATQSSTGKLDIFCRAGSAWTKDIANVTIGTTAATKRFDIEFEKTSGIPMVLYSTNTATTNELSYYRKTGAGCGAGSWTGPTVLNPTRVTGIVLWVELEARQTAGSNVLAAAFSDANATAGGKLEAMIWNGSWGNESPVGAAQGWSELSLELSGTAGAQNNRSFDLAFETISGDLFIAWGTSTGTATVNGWRYATCSATLPCTWSGVLTPAGPADDATVVACAPDPGSDAIACIAEGNAGSDLTAWLWSGTAVGATTAATADATLLAVATGDRTIDIDWVVSGTQRMAVGVYAETTTGVRYIYYDTVGAAWRTNTTASFTPTGAPATALQSVQVLRNPSNAAQLLTVLTDANSDLISLRLNYNGAAGGATTALSTWNASTGSPVELTVSSITSQPFWFDWAKVAPAPTTTLATGSDPAATTIAPGAAATDVDLFTLQTSTGTEAVTSVTVNLSTNAGIGLLAITDNANTVLGSTASPVTGSNIITVSGLTAGTGILTFKVRATPLSHAAMPVPAGGAYAITAPVTAWAGPNVHAGSDTNPNALTIDNLSPNSATAVSGAAGNAANTINWTTSNSADFNTTNGSVVLRWASGSAGAEVPAEGNSTYTAGNTITTATVACVISSATSAAQSKIDGTGGSAGCTATALTNGQAYTYKAFQRDTNGNYDVGVLIGTFTPSAPAAVLTVSTFGSQTATLDSGVSNTHLGGALTFSINTGTASVTGIKVSNNGTAGTLSDIRLYYDTDGTYSGGESCFNTVCTDGGGGTLGTSIAGTLAMTSGNTYYIYVIADIAATVAGGLTADLQITNPSTDITTDATNTDTVAKNITGSTTVRPNVTDVTNSPLADGGRNGETFTITGTGFGTACGSVSVQVEGTALTCNSANNTTISATIPGTQITTYGGAGASGLLVTIGGTADDARQTYYIYPSVNLVSTPLVANAAREGENITLTNSTANASRFGATQGTVTFSGGFGSVSGSVVSWGDTSIQVTVPAGIGDNVYLGDITVTRNADAKTDLAYDSNGFRVLPKIASTTPLNLKGGQGDTVAIAGDHLCQSGTCPSSFSAANSANFNGGSVTSGASVWTDTSIPSAVIPGTAIDGNLTITSNTSYTSNALTYNIKFAPSTPTGSSAGGSNNPTLSGTAFSDGTDADGHQKTQWQIAHNTDGDWTTPEWTRTSGSAEIGTTVNTTNGTFANSDAGQTELDCGTTYKGRARYMDNANGGADAYAWEWSSWSANYTFSSATCNVAPTLTVSQPDGTGDTVNVGDLYNITYDLADPDNVVTAAMYYDTDAVGLNGTAITGACATAAEGTGATCSWNTTSMTPGTYYVYGITNDGINPAVSDYSPGVITINAPPQVTADASGTQTTIIDSGATGQYIGATFRFQQTTGSADTITVLTISETGTVNANANLSTNAGVRYESGVVGCTYNGTETLIGGTFNVSEQMALSAISIPVTLSPNFTCVYLVFNVGTGAVGGQTIEAQITSSADFTLSGGTTKAGTYPVALSGSTTIRPNVTSATNSPLGDGGRNGETFTITGAGFGTACGSVSVQVEGTTLTCNSANNTTISATIPSTQTTTYGGAGASGMLVTVGGTADDARQTYYVYPSVNLVSTPSVANAAREADDITLTNSTANAARFGATQGTVTFSGGFGSVSGSIVSWGDTSIQVTVPAGIGDNVYLGDITVTRNADSKTDLAYDSNGFRVLPRITSNTQNNGVVGDIIKITGDHFCQGAGCPAAYSRSSATNNVKFDTTQAVDISVGNTDFVNTGGAPCSGNAQAWTDSEICVKVPAGISTGSRPTQITSNTSYISNAQVFTVNSSAPNNPNVSGSRQYKSDNATVISAGGTTNESTVILKAGISASISINMALQVEIKPTGTAFTCGAGDCVAAVEGTVEDGGACTGCSLLTNAKVTITSLSEGQKHWQARARNTTSNEYSGWISFGTDPDSVFEIDLIVDTIAPSINPFTADNITTNAARITWETTGDFSSTQLAYGTDATLITGTATTTETDISPTVISHTVNLSNLSCGIQYYYYRARARDNAGNVTFSAIQNFQTNACPQQPAKTTVQHIIGATGPISAATTYYFTATTTETFLTIKSAYVEVTGLVSGGSNPINVQVNAVAAKNYSVSASTPTLYRFIYKVTDLNTDPTPESVLNLNNASPCTNGAGGLPPCNKLIITPGSSMIVNIASAKLILTYAYTP